MRPYGGAAPQPSSAPPNVSRFPDGQPSPLPSASSISSRTAFSRSSSSRHPAVLSRKQTFDEENDVGLFAEALSGIATLPMTEPLHQGPFYEYHDVSAEHLGPSSSSTATVLRSTSSPYPSQHYQQRRTNTPGSAIPDPALPPTFHVVAPLTPTPTTPSFPQARPHAHSYSEASSATFQPHPLDYSMHDLSLNEALLGLGAQDLPFHTPDPVPSSSSVPHLVVHSRSPEEEYHDDDEELPSYEQSQRETAERTRRQASSRAAELEQRWARSSAPFY